MKFVPGGILDGRAVVATAGTRAQLSTDLTEISSVTIQGETDNSGSVTVGDTTVVDTVLTRRGINLTPGDSDTIAITQLHFIWLDSENNGDGVTFRAEVV